MKSFNPLESSFTEPKSPDNSGQIILGLITLTCIVVSIYYVYQYKNLLYSVREVIKS